MADKKQDNIRDQNAALINELNLLNAKIHHMQSAMEKKVN